MSRIERVTSPCPMCGGGVISIRIGMPWGDDTVAGACGRCAAENAERERAEIQRRAVAVAAEQSAAGDVDVWPGLEPFVARVMGMTRPGLIFVHGDMMSGRTTLARAWVDRSIRTMGIPASYVEADRICRMDASAYAAEVDAWQSSPRLAIDGVAQWRAGIRDWQADRFTQLLSARHRLLTLVTVPSEAALSQGGSVMVERLGEDLARRMLMMAKISGQHLRLRAEEVHGE